MTEQKNLKKNIFNISLENICSANYQPQLRRNLVTVGALIGQGEEFKRNVQVAFRQAKNLAYFAFLTILQPYQNKKYEII